MAEAVALAIFIIWTLFSTLVTAHRGALQPSSSRGHTFNTAANRSNEKLLIEMLVDRYRSTGLSGRPVFNASDTVSVAFGLAIIQILDLDENRQFLRTNCWLRYSWTDPLLEWASWNNSNFENITQVRLYPELVWTPDIRLFNFADTRLKEQRTARVVVYSSGSVLWIPQSLFKSTCPVEIEYFPFDSQTCDLDFGSWTYDVTQINLTWFGFEYEPNLYEPNPYIDFTNYIKSPEWITDGQDDFRTRPSERRRQIRSRMECKNVTFKGPDGRSHSRVYQRLVFKIRIHRNPDFYLSILVLPCILMSCLTWVIFWLPPESPAKMLLGMNIFVAFFILLVLLAKTTPSAVSTFPKIGYFYGLNMVMITLSTFLAAVVLNLYMRADRRGRMGPVLRLLILEGLGRLFLVRQTVPLKATMPRPRPPQQPTSSPKSPMATAAAAAAAARKARRHRLDAPPDEADRDSPLLACGGVEREVREIRQFLKAHVGRLKEREKRNQACMEWRTLAIVLDRLFFTAYVLCIVTAVIILIPRSHQAIKDSAVTNEEDCLEVTHAHR